MILFKRCQTTLYNVNSDMLRPKRLTEEFHNGYKCKLVISANGTLNNTTGDVAILSFELNNLYNNFYNHLFENKISQINYS